MRLPMPRSLAARLALLLVLAVVAAQAASFAMFANASTEVGRAAAQTQVIDRVATLVRLLDTVPANAVADVVVAFNTPRHRFTLGADSLVPDGAMGADETRLARNIDRRVKRGAGQKAAAQARLALVERVLDEEGAASQRPPARPQARSPAKSQALRVSVRLEDGRWLNGESPLLAQTPPWMRIALYQLAASVVAVLAVVALGLRGIVGPVRALAEAAEQAGRGAVLPPLPERGPRELRTMTAAFNRMQARLRAFVDDRTRMLAAISHDLRTPIASLWLRAEMVEDESLRSAMVRTLTEMKRMVEATLSFARDDAAAQESGPLDLAAMARLLVDDHRALGRDASLWGPDSLPFHGRPLALRRALDNLVENAVRYGGCARIFLSQGMDGVRIRVEDEGPGLPPDRIEQMFEPFARLDDSRSDETGGTGLGLSIARSGVRAHGGEITLSNRPVRGLRAEIVLPSAGAPALCQGFSTQSAPASPPLLAEQAVRSNPMGRLERHSHDGAYIDSAAGMEKLSAKR